MPKLVRLKISKPKQWGTPKLVHQKSSRLQGTPSWSTSLMHEQFKDQAQRRFGDVKNCSRADQVQHTSAVFKCRHIYKHSDQVRSWDIITEVGLQFYVDNLFNHPVKKGVLADDLDEVSEWSKRTCKHTVALDEKNSRGGKPDQGRENMIKDPSSWMLTMGKQKAAVVKKINQLGRKPAE
ncbi:hypothetical protein F511_31115 [Dorcoceras hygrometricum]|uniref:Uncharacterized protein n=1 Tax=Dorcoceras hygrometricum TaxID=472368 RepID=A0A2Z7BGW2_9LAMI|nr:hypothetical protein F511_31115 [Dorcoceras hygrometricum]